MNNKPQSQDEPKTAFIPEIEVPDDKAQVREQNWKDRFEDWVTRSWPENNNESAACRGASRYAMEWIWDNVINKHVTDLFNNEDESIRFSEWTAKGLWSFAYGMWYEYRNEDNPISGKQLFQLFKEDEVNYGKP